LDEIQTRVFTLEFFSLLLTALPLPLTLQKGGKPDRKPYPLSYGLRNPYRNLKAENSQDDAHDAQKPQ
jgi:hypothetical protein